MEDFTGWATLALAAVTTWTAIESKRASKAAATQAKATGDLAEQGREQMRRSALPIVVPVVEQIEHSASYPKGAGTGGAEITVPVTNYGASPALGLTLHVEMLLSDGKSHSNLETLQRGHPVTVLSPSSTGKLRKVLLHVATEPMFPFTAAIEYRDAAARGYRTTFKFDPETGTCDQVSVAALSESGKAAETLLNLFD
jgi:hypothetical protein